MNPKLRIVTAIPLTELWNDAGPLLAKRERPLTPEDLQTLLRQGHVQFVVGECGKSLRWIEKAACYQFWKGEAKLNIASPDGFSPDDWPEGRCYLASEWVTDDGESVIVLETYH